MGNPTTNGTATAAPAKPGGIRIIRSTKPAAGENGTPKHILTKPGVSPKSPAPVEKSGDEIWAEVLSQSEGDIPTAILALVEKLTAANAPAASAIAAAVDYVGVSALSDHGLYPAIVAALEA